MSRQKTTFTSEKEQKRSQTFTKKMKKSRILAQIINFKAYIA